MHARIRTSSRDTDSIPAWKTSRMATASALLHPVCESKISLMSSRKITDGVIFRASENNVLSMSVASVTVLNLETESAKKAGPISVAKA